MSRRSADQIKKDYRTIKHYIRKAQTIKKIASGTGLTVSQVRTSLATYPLHNQRSKKCNRKIQTQDETQERACSKEQFEKQEDMHELASPMYVIDASMLGVQDYEQFLDKMISEGAKIILTNVTISELDTAQKIDSKYGYCARAFLKRAVKNPDIFIPVLISESEYMSNNKVIEYRKTCNWHDNLHDNQIIAYCACSQEKIVLLTADKVMALNARALGVTVMFFENQTQSATTQSPASTLPSAKTETLNIADYDYDNKTLSVTAFITYQQSIRVCSAGIDFTSGVVELKIGDTVSIVTRRTTYLTFDVFKIVALAQSDNCILLNHKNFSNVEGIKCLPSEADQEFVRMFMELKK